MEMQIRGPVYVLGDNIDTDQIIPAEFLSYNPSDPTERKFFGKYANAGVPEDQAGLPDGRVPFIDPAGDGFTSKYRVVVGGKNFGCGSSREHAPLALAEAGIKAVVADFYARIFYRNSINGGYLLPLEAVDRIVEQTWTGDDVEIDLNQGTFTNHTRATSVSLQPLGDVLPIVEAGGVFAYAREQGMVAAR
jgi:3-isopropylmalate/(R)-2-methylmalate dehydratase small subunit